MKFYELKKITEDEFWEKINNRDGDLSRYEFDFEISFKYIEKIDFSLNFSKSVFRKSVYFGKVIYSYDFSIIRAIFEDEVDFFHANFKDDFNAMGAIFNKKVIFNLVKFNFDVDFNKTVFKNLAYFKKTRFIKNVSFQKTQFYKKIDFSYAHFSNSNLTSFININDSIKKEGRKIAPLFVFRNILFHTGTVFNTVDLSRTTFQDSMIEDIVFKECTFSKIDGRYAFYMEKAREFTVEINDDFEKIKNEEFNTLILSKNEDVNRACLLDRVFIKNKEDRQKELFFIVTKFEFENKEEAITEIDKINIDRKYVGVQDIHSKVCLPSDCDDSVIVLRLKKFDPEKHWEVLEDLYRQMKRSLEDSRDWQRAGDFYKGEMNAKLHLLKVRRENFWYQQALRIYKWVSYFGESMSRILLMLFVFGNLGNIVLKIFKPQMGFIDVLSTNVSLFLPIFGNTTNTLDKLNLESWQETIILFEILWFYGLWLILAIAMRRRFKR